MVIPWKIFAFRKSNRMTSRLLLDDGLEMSISFYGYESAAPFWCACVTVRVDYDVVGVCFYT